MAKNPERAYLSGATESEPKKLILEVSRHYDASTDRIKESLERILDQGSS